MGVDEQNVNLDNNLLDKKKVKKKKLIIIVIFISLLVIGGGSAFYILNRDNSQKIEDNKDGSKSTNEEKEDKEEPKNRMQVYKTDNGSGEDILCVNSEYCEATFLIPVYTDNPEILDVAYDNYVLYRDDKIYLYNHDTEVSNEIDIDMNANEYNLHSSENEKELYGISYEKNNKASYYNLENKELLYDGKYDSFSTVSREYIAGTETNGDDVTVYLLDAKEEKKPYFYENGVCAFYTIEEFGNDYYLLIHTSCIGEDEVSFYSSDFNKISDFTSSRYFSLNEKGELLIYNEKDKTIKEYNATGKVVRTYQTNGNVESIYEDIYLVTRNNTMYIKEYSSNMEYKLLDWKKEYYYHWMISGYYDAESLENEEEKEVGYYFIIGYGDNVDDYTEEESGIEFYFNSQTKELKSWNLDAIGGYAKPVLYLYPREETDVTIHFEHEESLTTTYPKFKDGWEVSAFPNGDLYDKDGKYYYGLYWEENLNHRISFEQGFYVTKDNAINFLEEKLSIIGLSDRERNEFIMYWLPILEKNGKSLVYFELTEERENFNKLEISPKPDSLLRIAIHVKKVNNKVKIKEQELVPFNRVGFVAVEWGGVIYN